MNRFDSSWQQALQSTSFPTSTGSQATDHLGGGDTVRYSGRTFAFHNGSPTETKVNDSMINSNLGAGPTASTGRVRQVAHIIIGGFATLIDKLASKVADVGRKIFAFAQKVGTAEGRSELKEGMERGAQQIQTKLSSLKEATSEKLRKTKAELPGRVQKFREDFPATVRTSVGKLKKSATKFFQQLRSSEGRKELKKDFEGGLDRLKKGAISLMERGAERASQMGEELQPKLDAYEARGSAIVAESKKDLKAVKKDASIAVGELKKTAEGHLSSIGQSLSTRIDNLKQRMGAISFKRPSPTPTYDMALAANTVDVLKQRLDKQKLNLQKNMQEGSDAGTIRTREIEIGETEASLKLLENPSKLNKFIKAQKKEHAAELKQIRDFAEGGIKQNEALTTKLKEQMGEVSKTFGDDKLAKMREEIGKRMDEKHALSKENSSDENILILMLKKESPEAFQCDVRKGLGEVTGPSNGAKMESKEFIKHLHDNLPSYLGLDRKDFRTKPSGEDPSGELLKQDKENNLAQFKQLCIDKGLSADEAASKASELNNKYNELIDAKRNLEIDGGSKYMTLAMEIKQFVDNLK